MGNIKRRKKVKVYKIYTGINGLKYADIREFCEDIGDVSKLGSVSASFVVLDGDVLAFDPEIERFVQINKSSRYHAFKQLLDAAKSDLIGERDGVWFFVGKEIDGYQGWVYWRDGLFLYQTEGWVSVVDDCNLRMCQLQLQLAHWINYRCKMNSTDSKRNRR